MFALLFSGLAAIATPASAAGNAQAGHALAQVWCSSCHMVDTSGQGRDTAPPFADIAKRRTADRAWLRAWLISPHPPMPNFNLSRQEIDDIVAYLDSLARG
ncbi:MAG TPA: c-type cytochrome [Stellaceae bacterium]